MTDFSDLTLIGLTGMSGAGKTTVCSYFRDSGVEIIDCDKVSREVVQNGKPCLAELCEVFSESILTDSGELDRRRLASVVFTDENSLKRLNDTIYPYISYEIARRVRELYRVGKRAVLIDAPTLFESGANDFCDVIVSVICDKEISKKRITARDNISAAEAENRLNSQRTDNFFRGVSDYCIENNGGTDELKARVLQILSLMGVADDSK